jgi:hypothetical protein
MDDWLLFQDPRFVLQVKYPRLSTEGEPVDCMETQRDGVLRVHILAPTSREVYFEITRYPLLSAKDEYKRHSERLARQFETVSLTDLKETQLAGLHALEYTFEWPQGTRTVALVERRDATYRILYDPRSSVNLQILSTLEWISGP